MRSERSVSVADLYGAGVVGCLALIVWMIIRLFDY